MRCQICEEETPKPHENALDCIQAYQERLRGAPAGTGIMDAIREWRDPAEAWRGGEPADLIGSFLHAMVTAAGIGLGMSIAGVLKPKKKRR